MADGEIAVSVQAEGTEDAVGEMGGGPEVGGGGAGGVGGGGGDGGSGGKVLGKLLTRILSLLAFLGPILDVIKVMTDIITAFVAPMAVMLLRILQPVMVLLLKILPFWLSFMSFVNDIIPKVRDKIGELLHPLAFLGIVASVIQRLRSLMGDVKSRLGDARDRIADVISKITDLPRKIWSFVKQLPDQIGSAIQQTLPDSETVNETAEDVATSRGARAALVGGLTGGPSGAIGSVVLQGGLSAFVDNVERNGSVDFP